MSRFPAGSILPASWLSRRVLQRLAARDDVTIVMTTPVPELVEEVADRIAIIRDGQLAAFDTADGLRRLTGTDGPLAEVLQRFLNPETLENIEFYFERDERKAL